jgi:simple sugar transport system permease protein
MEAAASTATARQRLGRALGGDGNLAQLLIVTVLIFGLMSLLVPEKFLRPYNFESLTYLAPELGLLSIAMMVAMLTGGIDLSIVGIANLSGILAGLTFHALAGGARGPALADMAPGRVALGVGVALATGLAAGTLNGVLIARLRIIPMLATIGSGLVFTGIALVLTGGPALVGYPRLWTAIGNASAFGLAVPLLVYLVIAGALSFLLSRTPFGVNLTLIGTNARAARFTGLRTQRAILLSYVLTGVLASIAGVILSARTNASKSDYGVSYVLQAVLIAVLGGTNPAGGRGSVLGVTLAVVALMFLSSGFQLMRFSNFLVDFIWGAFLLFVIALNALRARGRRR